MYVKRRKICPWESFEQRTSDLIYKIQASQYPLQLAISRVVSSALSWWLVSPISSGAPVPSIGDRVLTNVRGNGPSGGQAPLTPPVMIPGVLTPSDIIHREIEILILAILGIYRENTSVESWQNEAKDSDVSDYLCCWGLNRDMRSRGLGLTVINFFRRAFQAI